MNNLIEITACDNELVLFAVPVNANDSYQICNIKSGYERPVNVGISLQPGPEPSEPIVANGVSTPLNIEQTFLLPPGQYHLLYSGINWGGPYNFRFTFNGEAFTLENDPSRPLYGVIWNLANDHITFDIA